MELLAFPRRIALLVALLVGLSAAGWVNPSSSSADLTECTIGEVAMFAGNFAPRNWATADGQLLSIAQNTALFSILGTTYGGDGKVTFALPDLRGRVPMHVGTGPGLSPRYLGEEPGQETHTMTVAEMPSHDHGIGTHTHSIPAQNHQLRASSAAGDSSDPAGRNLATGTAKGKAATIYVDAPADVDMRSDALGGTAASVTGPASGATSPAGQSQPFDVVQPSLGLTFIVCLQGLYPSRN